MVKSKFRHWWLLALLLVTPGLTDTYAQVKKGLYTNLTGRTGQLEAQYKIVNGDTIFDGKFLFVIKQDLKDGHRFIKETYIGKYKDGLKTGKWEYDQLDLRYSVEDIENEKIQMIYWGKKEITDAFYKEGIPDGLWSYAYYHVDSSGGQQVEKVGSIHFENGKPFGDFAFKSLKDPKYELEGKFDTLARLDGIWRLNYAMDTIKVEETRNYNDGFLLSLLRKDKDSGKVLDSLVYEEVINKLKAGTVTKAKENFNVLFDDGFLLESPFLVKQREGNELLKVAYEAFLWADLGRGALEGSRHDFNPGTGRFHYELPQSFLENLDVMREDLQEVIDRSDEMLNNPKFYINFQQSELLSKSEAILKYEREKATGILDCVNSRADSMYEHIDREVYFADIYSKHIHGVDTIYYQYEGNENTYVVSELSDKDLEPFYKLLDVISIFNRESEKAMVVIKDEFENILQKQRLTALEQDIQYATKKVEESYLKNENSLSYKLFQKSIDPWSARIMEQYFSIDDLEKKEQEGRFILGTLEELKEVTPRIDSIENRVGLIDTAYTEFVFDPYTYSQNIRKRLKKRLYDAVAVDYYNHLKSELIEEKHGENILSKIERIEMLQFMLLELVNRNTRSIEKKLKKNSDIETIEKLLELEG